MTIPAIPAHTVTQCQNCKALSNQWQRTSTKKEQYLPLLIPIIDMHTNVYYLCQICYLHKVLMFALQAQQAQRRSKHARWRR